MICPPFAHLLRQGRARAPRRQGFAAPPSAPSTAAAPRPVAALTGRAGRCASKADLGVRARRKHAFGPDLHCSRQGLQRLSGLPDATHIGGRSTSDRGRSRIAGEDPVRRPAFEEARALVKGVMDLVTFKQRFRSLADEAAQFDPDRQDESRDVPLLSEPRLSSKLSALGRSHLNLKAGPPVVAVRA
jgi:hypothetical protein